MAISLIVRSMADLLNGLIILGKLLLLSSPGEVRIDTAVLVVS